MRKTTFERISELDYKSINKALSTTCKRADSKRHKDAVRKCRQYVRNNLTDLESYRKYVLDIVAQKVM